MTMGEPPWHGGRVSQDLVLEAYRESAWSEAARQLPFGLAVFLAMILAGTILDATHEPGRWLNLLAMNLGCGAVAAAIVAATRRPSPRTLAAAIAGTAALG